MDEIQTRFVDDYPTSVTRVAIWDGFRGYLQAWLSAEKRLSPVIGDGGIIRFVWFGGSFISGKLDPGNIDMTVFYEYDLFAQCSGQEGIGVLRKLFKRDSMLRRYRVSPICVPSTYVRSPFQIGEANTAGHNYFLHRGAWDDWWQRVRPTGEPKGEPTPESSPSRRGYVEVEL
ncbi:MAG TPA: hypothetical protein VIS06_21520 [Mycobacteriales bacterium]|jgi:hypothetical protein